MQVGNTPDMQENKNLVSFPGHAVGRSVLGTRLIKKSYLQLLQSNILAESAVFCKGVELPSRVRVRTYVRTYITVNMLLYLIALQKIVKILVS